MTVARSSLAGAAAVLALGGCVPTRPQLPPAAQVVVPADWRGASQATGDVQPEWWRAFGDPHLDTAIELARAANLDVLTAAERVNEARANLRVARAALLPTVGGQLPLAESRALNPLGRASEGLAAQPQFVASYEIDAFGRLADRRAASIASLASAEMTRRSVSLSVTAAVAQAYFQLVSLDAKLFVLEQTLDARREALRIARSRAEAGYTSDLELRQAEVEFSATSAQIPTVALAVDQTENALSVLTGRNPGSLARGRITDIRLPDPPAVLPSQVVASRPDILRAEYDLVAADRTLSAARKSFLPQISLSASVGAILSSQLDGPVSIWSLGGSVLAPIFDPGRLRGQFEGAEARRNQAAFAYRGAVLTAFREVENQLAAVSRYARQRDDLIKRRDAAQEALRHARNRYQAGYSVYLEQLDAQRLLLQVQLDLVQNRSDRLNAAVGVYQAVGGAEIRSP